MEKNKGVLLYKREGWLVDEIGQNVEWNFSKVFRRWRRVKMKSVKKDFFYYAAAMLIVGGGLALLGVGLFALAKALQLIGVI